LFTGCTADVLYRHLHWATARVLRENGCEVVVLRSQACCGAVHYDRDDWDAAREMADLNAAAFNANPVDAIVANIAGCGNMLREYGRLWQDDNQSERQQLSDQVRDVHAFLDELGIVRPTGEIPAVATYHDACRLAHAQGIRHAPRRLLQQIPGLELVEMPEADLCCGAAGTYHLSEPDMADRLSRRKLANVLSTGAQVVVAADTNCLLQIAREARLQRHRLKTLHPMELLDLSYRRQALR
jgi:glycolate oxidase iron-sulfur subunit